jgi:hypothetical protein
VWIARTWRLNFARSTSVSGLAGAIAGLLIPLLGGHLLGGSLNLLARSFPDARFRLDGLGALLGETSFGRATELATAAFEGALFGLCLGGALALARLRREQG